MFDLAKAADYQEQHRIDKRKKPLFHVTPPVGWMNDPNGFSVYQGTVHLFYQYYPYNDRWGTMHWGHCISEDFIKWQELPPALAPDMEYDKDGCFSGSAIETPEGHVLIYTGVIEETLQDGTKTIVQQQCLAVGDGVCYHKAEQNPIIAAEQLPQGFSREDFRDPKVWQENGTYYLVAGNKNEQQQGQVVLFESKDLRTWNYLSVLADNGGIYGNMWECPDFFSLGGKDILLVSPQDMRADGVEFHNGNQTAALIGTYDNQTHQLNEEQVVSLDYGTDFYAAQTLETDDGRRIMIAWMQSWDMDIKPTDQKWNGMMTIPRQLEYREGVLCQSPVRELEQYRTEEVVYKGKIISGECRLPGVQGRELDLTIELEPGDYQWFRISFAHNESYSTSFCYDRAAQTLTFDRTYCGMIRDAVCERSMKIKRPQPVLKLRLILDRFSAELFVNDGAQAFSATFYTPLHAEDLVFACDQSVKVNLVKYKIALEEGNANENI
ncbi:MAG: glycoside hydrolase family 32 protein [Lachnospiraceae bacterium]|nr:glycoside hydrolase family 32 protein [Lachnospiraceae bacterium]